MEWTGACTTVLTVLASMTSHKARNEPGLHRSIVAVAAIAS
ncbi:MAG: hypothetical protein OYH76_17980 [Defluviicoccus sp.]|nr:hypothetical protein [Defluviicoccus sp.]MDE0277787.1 hypothetical protein [Defluviicoccus sp.]